MSSMSNADEPRNLRSDSISAMATPLQLMACLVCPHKTQHASCCMQHAPPNRVAHSMHHTPHSTHHNTQHAAGSMWRRATYCSMRVPACASMRGRACIASARIFGVTVRERVFVCVCMCVRACVRACVRVRVQDQRAFLGWGLGGGITSISTGKLSSWAIRFFKSATHWSARTWQRSHKIRRKPTRRS